MVTMEARARVVREKVVRVGRKGPNPRPAKAENRNQSRKEKEESTEEAMVTRRTAKTVKTVDFFLKRTISQVLAAQGDTFHLGDVFSKVGWKMQEPLYQKGLNRVAFWTINATLGPSLHSAAFLRCPRFPL